jgi:magnesium transporter
MINPLLAPELRELLDEGDVATIRDLCDRSHSGIMAEFVAALSDEDVWRFLAALETPVAADLFVHFDLDRQVALATGSNRQAMALLLEAMPADDRADLVRRLNPALREEILPLVARADREDIRRLAAFTEGTAGALMSSDYAALSPELNTVQALDVLRQQAPDRETIYYVYVVDDEHRLLGVLDLKDLILARPGQMVKDLMLSELVSVRTDDDQEHVARLIERYDLIAIPVVDSRNQLVGIVTHDDALDVIRQEQTEDIEKFMGIGGRHEVGQYLKTSAFGHFRKRAGWVVGLAAVGLLSGMIIHSFEETLTALLILALYMPMVADTGGNTGSQSATVVIRALALGEIRPRDALRVLIKEFQVGLLLASVLGLLSFAKVLWLSHGADIPESLGLLRIGAVIALALSMQVVTATLIGAVLPLAAARLRLDPAVVASPALTTVVDITGLLIYFFTARLLLGV